jgi:hypothetical protein
MADGASSPNQNERGALIAGAAAALLSVIPGYIRVTFDGKGFDMSTNAWTGSATIGMVLLLAAAALIGIEALSDDTLPKAVPWHLISVIVAVLGTFLLILKPFTVGSSAPGASVGPGWSGWLLFIAAIALCVFAVRSFRESEEKLDFSA